MNQEIINILKEDYARFPQGQTYDIYAEDVVFKDPLNKFQGVERYRQMIAFMQRWFIETKMDLHDIKKEGSQIITKWTLSWYAPLPWKPQLVISGWSELGLNSQGLICSHIDYWNCSKLDVIKQLFRQKSLHEESNLIN